jgi:predicted RNA-binding Zn-ribbon protein involved in translation (DUF1610 family)
MIDQTACQSTSTRVLATEDLSRPKCPDCGSVIRRRKVLPTRLSRLRKFPRIAASMASRARANSCGQVAKAVGTGNNHDQRGVCIHYRGTVHKEEPHASNV